MGTIKYEILEFSDNSSSLSTQETLNSTDNYELLPIGYLPGSSESPYRIPQPYHIYIDPPEKIYRAAGTDAGMRAGYKGVVMLESSALFDEEAQKQTKNLYLVEAKEEDKFYRYEEHGQGILVKVEREVLILYRHNGKEWCQTSRKKDRAIAILESYNEKKAWNDPQIIEAIFTLYSCYLLEGKLENLELSNLKAPGLKKQIIEQMLAAGHIPARYIFPGQKKRQRVNESTIDNERNIIKRRLDFQDISNEEDSSSTVDAAKSSLKSDTVCAARVSSGLSPAQYSCTFFVTPQCSSNSEQEKANNSFAEVKARIEAGNGNREDHLQYASLLLEGSEGVEKNPELAEIFFRFADEPPEDHVASQVQNANGNIKLAISEANTELDLTTIDILTGPNPFDLEDNVGSKNENRLSPSF